MALGSIRIIAMSAVVIMMNVLSLPSTGRCLILQVLDQLVAIAWHQRALVSAHSYSAGEQHVGK
jgi:hypothetical protein